MVGNLDRGPRILWCNCRSLRIQYLIRVQDAQGQKALVSGSSTVALQSRIRRPQSTSSFQEPP